ncbi:MAG TPA: hypothetical protein VGC91_05140 [Pyrinomonadaceae bacterium]|jgi:hypothetical protein
MAIKLIRPTAISVFLGLLIAALMRMLWFGLVGKRLADPLGVTAICVALAALIYLGAFKKRDKS